MWKYAKIIKFAIDYKTSVKTRITIRLWRRSVGREALRIHKKVTISKSMIKRHFLSIILIILGIGSICAEGRNVEELERQLNIELANAKNPKDSVRIMYDLFDVVPRKKKRNYSQPLYQLAGRINRTDIQLDLLRQISQLGSALGNTDSLFSYLNEEIAKFPKTKEQEETALFIRMRQVAGEVRHADSKKIDSRITQLIADEPKAKDLAINLRVLRLFTIVEYLTSRGMEGPLLGEYVALLKERMGQANFDLYALNNILLTESANIYTTIDNPREAVEADKKMLKMIENLEKQYHSEGRRYRDYTPNKYVIYRRMLSNFPALNREEIEEYYNKIQTYVARDVDARNTENKTHLAELYYSMATGDYSRALPLIKARLEVEKQPAHRRRLVRWLQTAANATGDKTTEIEALRLYNQMLVERDTSRLSDRSKELEIRTRVSELKADKTFLEMEKEKEEKEAYQRMMMFVMVGWVVFAIILIIALFIWGKYRTASIRIRQFVNNLDGECKYLKDQQYKDYFEMHSDKEHINLAHGKVIRRRKRVKGIVSMLDYIMNDILYISSIGREDRRKYVRPVKIKEVVEEEFAIAKANQTSGAKLEIVYPEKDIEIRSDKECLEYVLHHIFFAANRVAEGGIIRLEIRERDERRIDFVFTNTSVYVPEGNEDVMFDNFVNVDSLASREDAGLFIARLSAMLLDSELYLEKEYKEGSRYVFSVSKSFGR